MHYLKLKFMNGFRDFKNGDMLIGVKPRSGHPSTSRTDENVLKIQQLVLEDRRRTVEDLSQLSGISWSCVQRILTKNLGMKRVAAKFVPRILTDPQKELRLKTCCAIKEQL
uniref:Transposase Tc1-like domain-containing protein n=1 Tax=Cuerna arida TaxID=1464854 RepID=A0A1B6F0E8_9HEMI